jgi:hypothetical protein
LMRLEKKRTVDWKRLFHEVDDQGLQTSAPTLKPELPCAVSETNTHPGYGAPLYPAMPRLFMMLLSLAPARDQESRAAECYIRWSGGRRNGGAAVLIGTSGKLHVREVT